MHFHLLANFIVIIIIVTVIVVIITAIKLKKELNDF